LTTPAATGTTNDLPTDVITVIEASYKAKRDEFRVRATSTGQPDVTLELLGFGPMNFSKGKYEFKLRPVGSTVIPPTVDIVSSGGDSVTIPVVGVTAPSPPGQASNPSPGDGASNVNVNVKLDWNAGAQTDSHDVYFGISANPPKVSGNQSGISYDPDELETNTRYYWRVDEVNALATTSGVEWSFTTADATTGDSIVITRAKWKSKRSELKVEATSTGAPDAILTVQGFGSMYYDARKNIYRLTFRSLNRIPGTVTVTSNLSGSTSTTVIIK
jgi:hypothetical protein